MLSRDVRDFLLSHGLQVGPITEPVETNSGEWIGWTAFFALMALCGWLAWG